MQKKYNRPRRAPIFALPHPLSTPKIRPRENFFQAEKPHSAAVFRPSC